MLHRVDIISPLTQNKYFSIDCSKLPIENSGPQLPN